MATVPGVRGQDPPRWRTRVGLGVAAGLVSAALVAAAVGLATGRPAGVEDNGDGFRLFCGAGLRARTVDGIASWKGGVVTDFVVGAPSCGASTPSSAGLVLRAATLGHDGSLALTTVAWWYVVLVGLVVAVAAWAASASVAWRASVLVVPVAPFALTPFSRFFLSTYGEPAGLLGTLAVACGIAALLVTGPGQRWARTVALVLTASGGAVAATAKVAYLPVLAAALMACAVAAVGVRRPRHLVGPVIAVVTLGAVAVPVVAAIGFQDRVYGGANVHDVVFTLALTELGPGAVAELGLPPEAVGLLGDGFFSPTRPPDAPWWIGLIRDRADETRSAAHAALLRHPDVLARALGVGLQATTRADLPYLAPGPGDPTRPSPYQGDPGWSGSRQPDLRAVLDGTGRPPWLPSALVVIATVAAASSIAWRRRAPTAARWCLAAGAAAVTALALVTTAVLGDGYFEVFKHVWLAAYLLLVSGLCLVAVLVAGIGHLVVQHLVARRPSP